MPISAIYTTKIDGVVCPPNISETVAGRLMKLAHRPRIASTMIKLISKPILLPILLILVKTIQRIVAVPKRFSQSQFSSTTAVARTIAYCVLAHFALQWNSTFRLDSFRSYHTMPSHRAYVKYEFAVYPLLTHALSTSRVSSLKLVYSKQPIIRLTQELCWVRACVGG